MIRIILLIASAALTSCVPQQSGMHLHPRRESGGVIILPAFRGIVILEDSHGRPQAIDQK
jgi:hypothetical protein